MHPCVSKLSLLLLTPLEDHPEILLLFLCDRNMQMHLCIFVILLLESGPKYQLLGSLEEYLQVYDLGKEKKDLLEATTRRGEVKHEAGPVLILHAQFAAFGDVFGGQ